MAHDDSETVQMLALHGDAAIRRALAAAARRTGRFRIVRQMANARFALEFLLEALQHRNPSLPELIVLDLEMPGLNGVQFTRELRRRDRTREILIAVLASAATARQQDAAETAGCDYFLRRPNSPEAIDRVLSALATRIATHRDYAVLEARLERNRFPRFMLTDNVV